MSPALTDLDRRILRQLQRDCTLSSREAAAMVGVSQSTYWRRTQELEQAGVITARVALLDPHRVGVAITVLVHVTLSGHGAQTREAFQRFVHDTPDIVECVSVTGEHDYTLLVRTVSVSSFEALLMGRILAHPSVASASSHIALRRHKYTTALPI